MTNHTENTGITEFGRILQAALEKAAADKAAAETPEQERERLVAAIKELKLPGYALAGNWSTETLRKKVAEAKKAPKTKKVEPVTEPVVVADVEPVAAVTTNEVASTDTAEVAETTVATEPTPAPSNEMTEANGFVVGQIVPAKVTAKLSYGVLVALNDTNTSALLHVDEMAGGTFFARSQRNKEIAKGAEVAVEVISIRPPKDGDKKGRARISVSEKTIQDRAVVESLTVGNDSTPGATVVGTVKEARKDFVLINITEGPAAGRIGLCHATEVPGKGRKQRDAYIAGLTAGQEVSCEVISVEAAEKKGDLRIGLTMVGEERRSRAAMVNDLASASESNSIPVSGQVIDIREYGAIVKITEGPAAGYRGLLHPRQVPGRTKEDRDAYIASLNVGDTIDADIIKAEPSEKEGGLRIALSIVAGKRRERTAVVEEAMANGATMTGKAVKPMGGGFLVECHYADAVITGLLPASKTPAGLKNGGNVKVQIDSVDGEGRINFTR
ncbi:MAG: hypothetical protein AB7W16_21065 [Candidatus Obscuribacterales bacterium]